MLKHRSLCPRVLILALVFVLSACSRSGASGSPISLPELISGQPQSANGTLVGEAGLNTLEAPPERPLYVLNATLDYQAGTIQAQQRIEFVNPSNEALSEIKFNVPPARRAGAV
jgi:hypothetical protein